MRFLCLHGIGTNSKIFDIQTSAIRYELADDHSFDFVEGTVPWEATSEVRELVTTGDQCFSYFDESSAESILQAVKDLDKLIHQDGPFDGVIAFSQGVILATTLIIQKLQDKKLKSQSVCPFKCGIFFSPAYTALDYTSLMRGVVAEIDAASLEEVIDIPTAVIWGSADPLSGRVLEFSGLVDHRHLSTFVHQGGHELPGWGDKDGVTGCVNTIRRVIDAASDLCIGKNA